MNQPRPATSRIIVSILRGALRQARVDLRTQLLSPVAVSWLIMPAIVLLVLFFTRDQRVLGSDVTLAQLGLAGVLTMTLVTGGFLGIAGQLLTEREDGTLLRAKAVPQAMSAQLLGGVLVNLGTSLVPLVLTLAVASLIVDGVTPTDPGRWVLFVVVCVLGLLACLPWGALVGALLPNAMLMWLPGLGLYAALAISGVFYPLSALPGWLQVLGQALPTYWVGLGLRQATLPPEAVALELGQSWHTPTMFLVLIGYSVVGLIIVPSVLRRMARRQSGSSVAQARERVLVRGY